MSLTNASQLLMRNIEQLHAESLLLVNAPADSFCQHYAEAYPQANIACFNVDYGDYQGLVAKSNGKIKCYYGESYQAKQRHDVAVIHFPKSKAELGYLLTMLGDCLSDEALIYFVGDNKGGVKSAPKLSQGYLTFCHKVDAARHCILFSGVMGANRPPFIIDDWFDYYSLSLDNITLSIAALPGVFSQQGLDKGTAVLLNNLPTALNGKVLDFGCGAGVISAFVGKKHPEVTLSLLDINALAIASSKRTLEINQLSGEVFASNALGEVQQRYDHVLSNPPFHQGIKTHYAATESFLAEISQYTRKGGSVTVVANSFLSYQPIMEKAIGKTERLLTEKGFTIYHSVVS